MNFEWKTYIRSNFPELLKDIDTRGGLEGEIRRHNVLPAMTVKRIWSIRDEIRRVSELLDQIQRGGTERYQSFCAALVDSDQKHIVDQYLTKCLPKDSPDAAPYQLENPLSKQMQRKLCEKWNDIIASLESGDELLGVLEQSKVFTELQIRKLKGLDREFERNEQILRYLEKTSQEKFQRFCEALHSTSQGHLVRVLYDSQTEGIRTVNEVVEQTAALTVEDVSAIVVQPECKPVEQPVTNISQPADVCHPDPDDAAVKSVFLICPSTQLRFPAQCSYDESILTQGSDQCPQPGTNVAQQIGSVLPPSPDLILKWQEEVKTREAYDIFHGGDCDQKTRGVALIVANTNFSKSCQLLSQRSGTDADIRMLRELLTYLKFDIHLHSDLTQKQIFDVFRQESKDISCEATVLVVFILSHGVADAVYGIDGKLVNIEDLVTLFDGKHCSKLVGKPKLFFIQACQGSAKTTGVDMSDSPSSDEQSSERIRHEKADILQVFSSYPGFVSFRNTESGSYFVQFIYDVFMKHAHEKHVADMINLVAQKVNAAQMDGAYKQTCQVKNSADKHIYLFPY